MSFANLLRRVARHSGAHRRLKSPRPYRPRLEMLEDRNLLSMFTVDHLADDLVGSGPNGSLRYCLSNAANGDTITFGVTGTINLSGALPALSHDIDLEGPGAGLLTVRHDTGGYYSVFDVAQGTAVIISGMTITSRVSAGNYGGGIYVDHGRLTLNDAIISGTFSGEVGGGIDNQGGEVTLNNATVRHNSANVLGGGIYNAGTLTLNNSTVSNNYMVANYPSDSAAGGGIFNDGGEVTLNNSTVSNNSVTAIFPSSEVDGGGIYNRDGTLTLNNSTVSGNSADSTGGGIINSSDNNPNHPNATVVLLNSTVANNTARTAPQLYSEHLVGGTGQATIQLRNTIIAGNGPGPNLSTSGDGTFLSQGYNLSSDDGSGFLTGSGDLTNTDPLLGPLQDNGGPTQTMALLAGSPALNAGDPAQLGVADQRGVVRTDGVNIGAYQASIDHFVVSAPASVPAGQPFDVMVTAVDVFGQAAVGYTGTVSLGSDVDGPLGSYSFALADYGAHTFSGVVLLTPGLQRLSATDEGGFSGFLDLTVT